MAGGKLSARQKMINLMYLIFIAMLAMQMSKKVLSSFGRMNDTLIGANTSSANANTASLTSLATLATDQPQKYGPLNDTAKKLSTLSNDFNAYLEGVKTKFKASLEDINDFESQSGSDAVDKIFFENGKNTAAGQEFVDKINAYRENVLKLLGTDFNPEILAKVKSKFNTDPDIVGKKGKEPWLMSRFEGFPLIASRTNITKMQNDIKSTETEVYGTLVGGQMKSDVSLKNYEAMVVFSKNAYYPGERLEGKIVLGKNDPSLMASKVIVNGVAISKANIQAGQVKLSKTAGNVGEHEIKGKFYFMENGEEISIDIVGGKYSVIPKPNEAVISADKMNVVYRGLANPITISIPGVPNNKVTGSANGLVNKGGGKYMMNPPAQKEIKINVTGKLPSGETVRSSKMFRIKNIPSPMGTIRGSSGYQKMSKSSLVKSTIGAKLEDFVFDLQIGVSAFSVKVPGKATIKVRGNRFDATAVRAINKARRGDVITILNIKANLKTNSSYRLKKPAMVSIEITS